MLPRQLHRLDMLLFVLIIQAGLPAVGVDGWGKGNIEGITGGVTTAEGGEKIYIICQLSQSIMCYEHFAGSA